MYGSTMDKDKTQTRGSTTCMENLFLSGLTSVWYLSILRARRLSMMA